MAMEHARHEEILASLNNPELAVTEKTELLQELRADYGTVLTDLSTQKSAIEKLQSTNDDLVIANSSLFRQAGFAGSSDEERKKEEEKSFSETITLEALERG